MIVYEYSPSGDVSPIFRIEIDTDSRFVAVHCYRKLYEQIERIASSENTDKEAKRIKREMKNFWKNCFCREERIHCKRGWSVTAVLEYLMNNEKEVYQFLIKD